MAPRTRSAGRAGAPRPAGPPAGTWARRWALASAVLGAAVVVATYVNDVLLWRWVETQPVQPTLQDPMDWVTGGLGAVLVVGGLLVAALRR